MKKRENSFEYDETKVVRNRGRYLLDGEIVALQCITCKEVFELDGFRNNKRGIVGKHNECKTCDNKRNSQWQKENLEKNRAKANRWIENNPYDKMASKHNYRAKQAGNKGKLTGHHTEELYWIATRIENGKEVVRCLISGEILDRPCIGHVIAVDDAGGNSELGNLLLISPRVNKNQGSQNMLDFLLTERGQALADKERVRWSIEFLAQKNSMSVLMYLMSMLANENELKRFYELYM